MTVLLDSDILIQVSRGRDVEVLSRWNMLRSSLVSIMYSPVSAAEIWAGARSNEFESTAALFTSLHCAVITHEIGELAGELLRGFAKSHSLEIADALIAASAVHYDAKLWTRNRKHYPMQQLTFY